MRTCVWIDKVLAVVNCEITTAYIFQAVVSFPHVAQHTCIPGNMWARIRMMGRTVSLSLCPSYRNKETGFGLAADAAENLSFDVATAVVLRFAKLGLESKYTLLGESIKSSPLSFTSEPRMKASDACFHALPA